MNFIKHHMTFIFLLISLLTYLAIRLVSFLSNGVTVEVDYFIFLATLGIALVAYYEFDRSHHLTRNKFLLFASNRWSSREIVRARQILHEVFVQVYRNDDGTSKCSFRDAMNEVSRQILSMSRDKGKKGKKFIYLLNLLDYLETLSYFYIREDLKLADVQNTCGNNAIFFYESFQAFIEQRQSHDKTYFINFTNLYHDLKKEKAKPEITDASTSTSSESTQD